jgi:putative colanic acid biosysnthesis UDP-glucose lipid carrier transferase
MFTSLGESPRLTRKAGLKKDTDLKILIEERKSYRVWKRIFDVVFSLLMMIFVLSWLFPIIALLIRLDSRGPVFFIQRRVGFLGRTFNCFKFRTMIENGEANTRMATNNDPRITKLGRILRKSNLDELPQFFNVLVGDMSVVGPRPHMHKDCSDFSKVVSQYQFRNLTKPGITGLAQSKGFRGPAKDYLSIFHRYQWDAFYVRNANFWLDMRIVRKTAVQTLNYVLVKGLSRIKRLFIESENVRRVRFAYRETLNNLNFLF